jgi:hypothetical protein
VAIIGSFRHHYDEVCRAAEVFASSGLRVASPTISRIVNPGADFVRFEVDPVGSTDAELQEQALARILAADVVYVVAPGGYVGRTTCYELGVVCAFSVPLYFSEIPTDLPIAVPSWRVCKYADLARELTAQPVRDQAA